MQQQPFVHGIDLSAVSHRPGQSPDLEPKRRRAWERMDDRERRYVVDVYGQPAEGWDLPLMEAGGAFERVLYVLATTGVALSAGQIGYLLVARHYRNADIDSIRKQLAVGVRRGAIRAVVHGRYAASDDGVDRMRSIEQRWRAARQADRLARVARAANAAARPVQAPRIDTQVP